jgi:putative ABC transport system permease protein
MSRRRATGAGWRMLTGTGTGASAALGLLVLVTVFIAMAVPRASLSLRTHALQHTLAQLPAAARTVTASIDYGSFSQAVGPTDTTGELAANLAVQARTLTAGHVPVEPAASWSDLSTGQLPTSGAARRAYYGDTPPQFQLMYRDTLRRNARLVTGSWPVSISRQGRTSVLQAAVTPATAARFELRPGSRLQLAPGLEIAVTGIVRPVSPASAFWTELGGTLGPFFVRTAAAGFWTGGAFVGPGEVAAMLTPADYTTAQVTWVYPLDLSGLGADQATAALQELNYAAAQTGSTLSAPGGNSMGLNVTSGVTQPLADFITAQDAVSGILSLLFVSLAVLGIVVLVLADQLLGERRGEELTLMRARGATGRQLAWLVFRGSLLVTLPAAALAGALAVAVTPDGNTAEAWWLAAATVAAALAGPALLAGRRSAGGRPRRRRQPSSARVGAIRRLVAELTLIGIAIAGLIVLRQEGLAAGGSVNALASAAPVLVAVPVAILVVRLCPAVLGWLQRMAGRGRGVVAFVGLIRSARRAVGSVLPVFALVLALAVVAFGGTVRAAVSGGEQAAAWQQAGADAVVGSPTADIPLTAPARRALAAVPGVRRAAAVLELPGSTGPNPALGSALNVAIVDPGPYAALLASTPAPPFPAAALSRPAGLAGGGRVPVVASPAAAALLRRSGGIATVNGQPFRLAVRAELAATAAAPPGGPFIVLPAWAENTTLPPTMLLLSGPHIDQRELTAVAARTAPAAIVTFRSAIQAALASAPLPQAAYVTYAQGSAAAALFCVLVVLISLLLGGRARELVDARLATMGLSAWQARQLGIVEAVPFILAAAAGGVAAAVALVPLIGPELNLSVFTGGSASVSIQPDVTALAVAAGGLVLLALGTLACQAVAAHRRGVARSLRVGE